LETERRITNLLPITYVVRPGLVYDERPGGMVGALSKLVSGLPVVPVVDHGDQVMYLAHSRDLSHLILSLCTTTPKVTGPIIAACEQGIRFKELLVILAHGRKIRFFNVPRAPLIAGLRFLEYLGLRSRTRSDSLVSLLNQNDHVDFFNTRQTGVTFRRFQDWL
jgi:nucleoside-diphosphate-sugar epimerase